MPRFFYGWWVVIGAGLGLAVHLGPAVTATFGIFLKPLSAEFGWSRSEISLAFSVMVLSNAFMQPLIGRWVDRVGVRPIALTSAVLFGAVLASFFALSGALWQFYLLFLLVGLTGSGTTPVPYSKVVSQWFDRRRGLALALAVSGSSLGMIVLPPLTQAVIDAGNWRAAYVVLGLLSIAVAVPAIGVLIRESPSSMGLLPDGAEPGEGAPAKPEEATSGVSVSRALRDPTLWVMMLAFFSLSVAFHGCIVHLVPMLTDRGLSAQTAALASSVVAVGVLVGRIGSGLMLDRVFAPRVGILFFSGFALAILLFWSGGGLASAFVGAALLGLAQGAELDLMAYLVGRYFGLRSFGQIYSLIFMSFVLGGPVGPLILGFSFDQTGSYMLGLSGLLVAPVFGILCMSSLGPYPRAVAGQAA